ncbi:hypothetical protein EDC04DRAFT_2604430 [Pisolithus marmoratus]|nr:hypothetical protein EDC04DRAFT_2604430 [Pisolithus marmoratus]
MNASVSSVVSPNELAAILESATLEELDRVLANLSTTTLLVVQERNKHILATCTNQDILEIIFSMVIDLQGSIGISHQDFHRDVVYANLLSIANQFWRFETLEIDAPCPYICEFFGFVPFNGSEAPQLHVLSLCGQNWQGLLDNDEVLPDELLALSPLNLEHLVLENFPFSWDVLKSGLVHSIKLSVLHICYPGESDTPHMLLISKLLTTLGSITSLQELKLHNVLKAVNENLLMEWVVPATLLSALQTLDLQAGIWFCSGFLNGVEAPALVELDIECNTTDEAGDAPLLTSTMLMISISRIVPHDPYNIFTMLHQKGNLWILLCSNQTGAFCQILVLQQGHPQKGTLEAEKQGKEVILLLPSLETITISMSLMLCILVDMIAELRESVGTPIDHYTMLRKMDTYQAAQECITVWLEGSFTQAEDKDKSIGESENSED